MVELRLSSGWGVGVDVGGFYESRREVRFFGGREETADERLNI